MKAQKPFFDKLSTLKNLPTLPHILLKLFESCSQDSVDLDEIAAIVGKDPSLSAKILKLVNSAYFGLLKVFRKSTRPLFLSAPAESRIWLSAPASMKPFPNRKRTGIST